MNRIQKAAESLRRSKVELLERHEQKTFCTYRTYVECALRVVLTNGNSITELAKKSVGRAEVVQVMTSAPLGSVMDALEKAWVHEALLAAMTSRSLGAATAALCARVAREAYHAVFAGCEALAGALEGRNGSDEKTIMRSVTECFREYGLPPWNAVVSGPDGGDARRPTVENLPAVSEFPHPLQRGGFEPLAMVGRCLLAEHRNRIDELWPERRQGKKRSFDPGPTNVVHFVRRLHDKACSDEEGTFGGNVQAMDRMEFCKNLSRFSTLSLLHMETLVMRVCGTPCVLQCAKSWLAITPQNPRLSKRVAVYENVHWADSDTVSK